MYRKILPIIVIFTSFLAISSCESVEGNNLILDENFDNNTLGWIEENTSSHYTDISDGYYRILSRDSNTTRTSCGSLMRSYLINLPQKYTIESSIKLINAEDDNTHFGIILQGASLEYAISIYPTGWTLFTEYDYNLDSIYTLSSKYVEPNYNSVLDVKFEINQNSYRLNINDIEIGRGELKMEPRYWYDLRLYASKNSAIAVNNLNIKK